MKRSTTLFLVAGLFMAGTLPTIAAETASRPADYTTTWEECGKHNGICKNSGKAKARYGYTDNWSEVDIKGDVDCMPEHFQDGAITGDPFGAGKADVDKVCERGK